MPKAPGPYAPPPYGVGGYFKVLPGIPGIAAAFREAASLYSELGRINHPAAPAKRALLARHIVEMEEKIRAGELLVAQATDDAVISRIRATQVRPDRPGGPRLVTGIQSRPIVYPIAPAFAVGQVDMELLNRMGANPRTGGVYWRSQEWGSSHNVGRKVRGAFQPGSVPPDQAQFRVHPIFTAGGGRQMTIKRPIEERAFLRSGVMQGALLRQRLWGQIQREGVTEVRRILTLGTPQRRGRP